MTDQRLSIEVVPPDVTIVLPLPDVGAGWKYSPDELMRESDVRGIFRARADMQVTRQARGDQASQERDPVIDVKADVVVRRFDPARDAESLRNCIIDHQDFHRGMEPSWPSGDAIASEYLTYLETECAAHNGCTIMAEWAEQTAGFVCVVASTRGESPEDPLPFAWIHDIFVKPEYRRRGVASALMAEAERFARSQGAQRLRLGVLHRNEHARALYVRHGFREHAHVLTKTLA
jgi:ribosomal protein S18 acetylase RimI-like enzyme